MAAASQAQQSELSQTNAFAAANKPQAVVDAKEQVMVRSVDEMNKQLQIITREDIQITLSATDPFSEEMRVFVANTGAVSNPQLIMPVSSFSQGPQANIKVYNCQNQEIASSFLYGNVVAVTANSLFYALYTTKS